MEIEQKQGAGEGGAPAGAGTTDISALSDQLGVELFGSDEPQVGDDKVVKPVDEGKQPVESKAVAKTPDPAAKPTDQTQQPSTKEVPKTWGSDAAKAEWGKLSPAVQDQILKREEDMFKGLETYKQRATVGQIVEKIFEPYMPLLKQHNVNPLEQVQGLMQAHYALVTGSKEQKVAMATRLLKEYGIELPGGAAPTNEYVDPEVARLREEHKKVTSRLDERDQRDMAAARETLKQKVDKFASDPANMYFDELATDIAALINKGMELEEAYQTAVYRNPVTRAKELARLQTERDAAAKEEARKKAEAAKKASGANVNSRPKAGTATGAPVGDLDEILTEGLADIRARH